VEGEVETGVTGIEDCWDQGRFQGGCKRDAKEFGGGLRSAAIVVNYG